MVGVAAVEAWYFSSLLCVTGAGRAKGKEEQETRKKIRNMFLTFPCLSATLEEVDL